MRIEYAKTLLSASDKSDCPVLVVGVESGFTSAAPFHARLKSLLAIHQDSIENNNC